VSAVALTMGPTSPASAISDRVTAVPGVTGPAGVAGADRAVSRRITLVTGDRVLVDREGRVLGLERAKGRSGVPVRLREADGHTSVLPADAARLVSDGRVDPRLFDVTLLNRAATRASQKQGLKVIVGYTGRAADARADVRDAGGTEVRRAGVSSRIDASWTFTSEKTERDTELPVSTVRFAAPFLGLDRTAPAGRRAAVRVIVQGAAADGNLGSLTVYVSDEGGPWTEVALRKGAFTHRTPAAGKSVSLRAEVTDKKGNTSKVTIHDAYAGR
jgi:hypothetical protein